MLLTALLVLAIVSSSALVFTNEVELLKLAVIIALWAAVAGAFISFIYRRQADLDQAKSRDLKLVYDLQLDREISARREYELSVETHLRRELASELRAQASDEVASLRAELAALRTNLEIIFDTDLQQRPAIETERTTVHQFGDWGGVPQRVATQDRGDRGLGPGRVISSRIDGEAPEELDPNTEESPIIDVPVEPHPPEDEWAPLIPGGAHRRPSEPEPANAGWRPPPPPEPSPQEAAGREGRRRAPEPAQASEIRFPWIPPEPTPPSPPPPPPRREPVRAATGSDWRPVQAEGSFIPAGAPGSNWTAPLTEPDAPEQGEPFPVAPPVVAAPPPVTPPIPAMTPPPPAEPVRPGRHANASVTLSEEARRARHSAPPDADPGRRTPTLAAPSPPPPPPATQQAEVPDLPSARHRGANEPQEEPEGQHIGGQPVSELMARLQVGSSGGGRRRRREE